MSGCCMQSVEELGKENCMLFAFKVVNGYHSLPETYIQTNIGFYLNDECSVCGNIQFYSDSAIFKMNLAYQICKNIEHFYLPF